MTREMQITFSGGKRVDATYDAFRIETDQSEKYGGEGAAPEPYDLFLASLGTCAGVYVLGFCDNRGIPTDGVRLTQRWTRDDKGRLLTVSLDIEVPEGFPARYHKALVRVANRCSVKRTVLDPPEFEIRTVVAGEQASG